MFPVQAFTANFRPEGTACSGEASGLYPCWNFLWEDL